MRGKKDAATFPSCVLFSSHNIYSALLQRIEHCSTRKSTCRLPIYIYVCMYILYLHSTYVLTLHADFLRFCDSASQPKKRAQLRASLSAAYFACYEMVFSSSLLSTS